MIYRRTGNIRASQPLLGHIKLESTVRYLPFELEDALELREQTELQAPQGIIPIEPERQPGSVGSR